VVWHCPLTTLESSSRLETIWSKWKPTRMLIHASRSKYGGDGGGATAMMTVEFRRDNPRPEYTAMEWAP
jgi:hypothetical protein